MARHLVIEIDRHGVNAVDVSMSRGRARPMAAVTAVRPPDVDAADPDAMGPWIRRVLDDAGIKCRAATLALSRERATFRRLNLPWADDEELPGMVELACGRELPIGAGEAVVDFLPLDDDGDAGPGAAGAAASVGAEADGSSRRGRRVLAAAVPRPSLDQLIAIASAAGLKVGSAMPRAMGAAKLVPVEEGLAGDASPESGADSGNDSDADADAGADSDGGSGGDSNAAAHATSRGAAGARSGEPADRGADNDHAAPRTGGAAEADAASATLLVDIGVHACEFLVVHRGRIHFVRAASIAPLAAGADVRRRDVVTETRRTWMSLRVSEDLPIARIVVLGDRAVAGAAVTELSGSLGVPGRVARLPDSIATRRPEISAAAAAAAAAAPAAGDVEDSSSSSGASADETIEAAGLWPLVGLALPAGPAGGLDFLSPRRAPDHRRIASRRVALVALLLIIVGGGIWTMGRQELTRLRAEHASIRAKSSELAEPYNRLQREIARRSHLRRWESVDPAWIEQFARLEEALPAPGDAVLDGLSANLDFRGVEYDRKERTWSVPLEIRLVVDGAARDLPSAGQVRGSYVRDDAFRVFSTGSDGQSGRRLPVGFAYRVATRELMPPSVASEIETTIAAIEAEAEAADAAAAAALAEAPARESGPQGEPTSRAGSSDDDNAAATAVADAGRAADDGQSGGSPSDPAANSPANSAIAPGDTPAGAPAAATDGPAVPAQRSGG